MPKFGRLPRTFNPAIPHYSSLRMGIVDLPPPPASVDWSIGVNPDWHEFLNDQLSDCTCAAAYHAMQLWSVHGRGKEITEPDAKAEQMYEEFCGYSPSDPSTDQGGIEQDVLTQWLNEGVPIAEGPNGRSKLIAFVEIDPRNHDDVKRVINECGGIYIGTNVPAYLVSGPIPMLWDVFKTGDNSSAGGHAIWGIKYDTNQIGFVSWGSGAYAMTWAFWDAEVDECYALVHPWWIESTGKTPLNMSVAQLDAAMQAIRGVPA
jgi:hypothetical protein